MKNGKATAEEDDFESSLLRIIQQHQQDSASPRHRTEEARKEALRAAKRVSELLVEAVDGGVEESFTNEKRIDVEIRSLTRTATRFLRQTDQWLALSRSLNSSLKEIGDFENWMTTMDYDCRTIATAIANIHSA
ncbi:GCN5L1 family protein [Wolffia australiana]